MKRTLLWTAAIIAFLLAATAAYAGALYAGWLPVPSVITGWIAQAKGLTPTQAQALGRTVNVYHVLKTAPEAPLVEKALDLAAKGGESSDWLALAREVWPQVTPETKEKIREQLAISPEDFLALDSLAERQMALLSQEGSFNLSQQEADLLNQMAEKYQLLELLSKLP